MNRNIINGRPLYLIVDEEKNEKSVDESIIAKIKADLVEPLKKLNIKIVNEIPKEENGTFLICNHCSNPLLKIFRCSRCKAVNYCQRQCNYNHFLFLFYTFFKIYIYIYIKKFIFYIIIIFYLWFYIFPFL